MKLELQSVAFKNFLSFGSRLQEVPFLRGLNLVTGLDKNKNRSNGAGKSSFLETVPFALFGRVHRSIKKDQIINWKNRKNCEVILNFRKQKNIYTVLRAIKPNKLEIYCDGTLIDRPAHVKDYQNTLDEILSINYPTFMSIIHSNINSSAKILSMSKPDKRKFMETMFGLGVYTRLNEKCNSKLKTIKDKIRELDIVSQANQRTVIDLEQRVFDTNNQTKKLHYVIQEFEQAREKIEELNTEFPNIKDDLESINIVVHEIEASIEYNNHLTGLFQNKTEKWLRMSLKNIDSAIKEFDEEIKNLKEYEQQVEKHGTLEQVEEKIKEIRQEISNRVDYLNQLKIRKTEVHGKINLLNRDIKELEKKIELFKNDTCPTCGQEIDDDTLLKSTVDERDRLLQNHDPLRQEWDLLETEIDETERDRLDCEDQKNKIERVHRCMYNKKISSASLNPKDYEKWTKDKERYQRTIKKVENFKSRLRSSTEELSIILNKQHHEEEELEHNGYKLFQLENNIRQMEIKAEAVQPTIKQYNETIFKDEMKSRQINAEIQNNKKKVEKLSGLKDYLEYTKFICKDENIKQEAISNIMPYMTKKTNFYLSEVDYGFYTVLNKWLDAEIKGAGITNASYGSLSGGEGRGIDIALQLAFLDIAKVQAGIFPDFLTFDELLDSSIDASGITELFKIVKTKQKDENSKVFIISHRSELENMDDIDNVYEVIKSDGYSTVSIKT